MKRAIVACVVVVVGGCELFSGEIACKDDGDCPSDVKFCVAGKCSADDDGGRDGRGIDGDGTCASDADCGASLCYDVDDDSGLTGKCVPGPDADTSCAAATAAGVDRVSGGPVISDALISLAGGCSPGTIGVQIEVPHIFDREGDVDAGALQAFVYVEGEESEPRSGGGSVIMSGNTGEGLFFVGGCVPESGTVAVRIGTLVDFGGGSTSLEPQSNALCVAMPAAAP